MKHRTRTLFVAVFAIFATVVAGTLFAYVTNSGSLSSGSWETAAGVSLQVPTTGTPKLAFTAQPGAGARIGCVLLKGASFRGVPVMRRG